MVAENGNGVTHHKAGRYKIGMWDNESARRWAQRRKFKPEQLSAFEDFLSFLETVFVNPADIHNNTKIDEGAFGSIEKAEFKGGLVVVKKVQQDVTSRKSLPQILRECLLELRIVKGLNHPNIVKFMGAAVHFPTDSESNQSLELGLVFDYCEKSSLSNNLRKYKVNFSFTTKLRFAKEIACGMAYLHDLEVLHRDLNTRNVLLTQKEQIKICDFGFARRCHGGTYDSTTISGTAEYMPPEQLSGALLTLKTDVWALGTILWELAAEKAPWGNISGDAHTVLIKKVADDGERLPALTAQDLPSSPADLADQYVRLLQRCMATSASGRPTMSQAYDQLVVLEKMAAENIGLGAAQFRANLSSFFSPKCFRPTLDFTGKSSKSQAQQRSTAPTPAPTAAPKEDSLSPSAAKAQTPAREAALKTTAKKPPLAAAPNTVIVDSKGVVVTNGQARANQQVHEHGRSPQVQISQSHSSSPQNFAQSPYYQGGQQPQQGFQLQPQNLYSSYQPQGPYHSNQPQNMYTSNPYVSNSIPNNSAQRMSNFQGGFMPQQPHQMGMQPQIYHGFY